MKNKLEINVKPGNLSFIENYLSDLYGPPQIDGENLRVVEKHYSSGISLESVRGHRTSSQKNVYTNEIIIPKSASNEIKNKLMEMAAK
ncbi:MAG: hypothetical protein Q8O84_05175 [Nanoarchaeota archaeon]|nr:hypothetical protein [Nanoarchaeota archaeon]